MNPDAELALFTGLLTEAGVMKGRDDDRIEWRDDWDEGSSVTIVNWRCDGKIVGRAFQLLAEAKGEQGACPECWNADRADFCMDGDCTQGRWPEDVRCAD